MKTWIVKIKWWRKVYEVEAENIGEAMEKAKDLARKAPQGLKFPRIEWAAPKRDA